MVASLLCSLEGFIDAIGIVSVDLKVRRLFFSLLFYLRLGHTFLFTAWKCLSG